MLSGEYVLRPDRIKDKPPGHLLSEPVNRLPACAVHRDNIVRVDLFHCVDGWLDDQLKNRPGKVEPAHDRMDIIDTCNLFCILNRVDDTGMSTPADHDKPLALYVDDNSLVIADGVDCPTVTRESLHSREPFLERRLPLYFPGHKQVTGSKGRGLLSLSEISPGFF